MEQVPIVARREFYDVPRCFFIRHPAGYLYYECLFDDELDDYPKQYQVYAFPAAVFDAFDVEGSWVDVKSHADEFLGTISVHDVRFDETRRKWIDSSAVRRFLGSQ